jgi:hypothetical protein
MMKRLAAGEDIASYCTRCRLVLEHVILAMAGGKIVQVKCHTCGSTHKYRAVTGTTVVARTKTAGRKQTVSKDAYALWETTISSVKGPEIPYNREQSYSAGDLISHAAFGRGIVRRISFGKCLVLFRDGEKLLVTSNC